MDKYFNPWIVAAWTVTGLATGAVGSLFYEGGDGWELPALGSVIGLIIGLGHAQVSGTH